MIPPRLTRRETSLVLALLVAGCAIRVIWPSRVSIEHYDEGVYSSSLWFGAESYYAYPQLHLYAPPLLPHMIETGVVLLGPQWGPLLPNLVAGCCSLLIVWYMSRRWFGAAAAIATLTVVSASDLHQLYTRTALVDAMLLMWLLLGLLLFVEGMRKPGIAAIGGAGISVGLAWCTKYNGWLPLAITAAALAVWCLIHRGAERLSRSLVVWLSVTLIATLVWLPTMLRLIRLEAVSAVASNHRQYVVGLAGWWDVLQQQLANHRQLDSIVGCLGLGVPALLAAVFAGRRPGDSSLAGGGAGWPLWSSRVSLALALIALAMSIGTSLVLAACSVLSLSVLAGRLRRATDPDETLVFCVLAVWLLSLSLATPLYHPYPRLTLPWLAAAWILGGLGMVQLQGWIESALMRWRAADPQAARRVLLAALTAIGTAGLAATVLSAPRLAQRGIPAIAARDQFAPIAAEIRTATRLAAGNADCLILVYAEPAVFFHLKALETDNVVPVESLEIVEDQAGVPTFLITGPHGRRTTEYAQQWPTIAPQLRLLRSFDYAPSELVRLNLFDPRVSTTPELLEICLWQLEKGTR